MEYKMITISREFGSGGRTIGKLIAEKLGLSYYDKELIEQVARQTGFDETYIKERGEEAPSKSKFAYAFVGRAMNGMSVDDYLWSMQWNIIYELAEKEPCVIVGRCADYILRERKDCFRAFIHADMETKAKRIVERYGEITKCPEKRLIEKDRKRSINYQYYTGQEWGMAKNYHISLDSGVIGIEECVDVIIGLIR